MNCPRMILTIKAIIFLVSRLSRLIEFLQEKEYHFFYISNCVGISPNFIKGSAYGKKGETD